MIRLDRVFFHVDDILSQMNFEQLTINGIHYTKMHFKNVYEYLKDSDLDLSAVKRFLFKYGQCETCNQRRLTCAGLCVSCEIESKTQSLEIKCLKCPKVIVGDLSDMCYDHRRRLKMPLQYFIDSIEFEEPSNKRSLKVPQPYSVGPNDLAEPSNICSPKMLQQCS